MAITNVNLSIGIVDFYNIFGIAVNHITKFFFLLLINLGKITSRPQWNYKTSKSSFQGKLLLDSCIPSHSSCFLRLQHWNYTIVILHLEPSIEIILLFLVTTCNLHSDQLVLWFCNLIPYSKVTY